MPTSTITGPKIQVPAWAATAFPELPEAQAFLHRMQSIGFNSTRSGQTASRPTSSMEGRWLGMPFFDTTLGITIWLSSVNPDVWVRYDGTPV